MDRVVPMLNVPDVRATAAWYETIGFVTQRTHEEEDGQTTWASLTYGSTEVMLNAGGQPSDAWRRDVDLYVNTRGVDRLHEMLRDRVAIHEAPHDTEYGQREFIVRDLNGFWITFGEPMKPRE